MLAQTTSRTLLGTQPPLRPDGPRDRDYYFEPSSDPQRGLHPPSRLGDEASSHSADENSKKGKHSPIPLDIRSRRSQQLWVREHVMKHRCQNHGWDLCQIQGTAADDLPGGLEAQQSDRDFGAPVYVTGDGAEHSVDYTGLDDCCGDEDHDGLEKKGCNQGASMGGAK